MNDHLNINNIFNAVYGWYRNKCVACGWKAYGTVTKILTALFGNEVDSYCHYSSKRLKYLSYRCVTTNFNLIFCKFYNKIFVVLTAYTSILNYLSNHSRIKNNYKKNIDNSKFKFKTFQHS